MCIEDGRVLGQRSDVDDVGLCGVVPLLEMAMREQEQRESDMMLGCAVRCIYAACLQCVRGERSVTVKGVKWTTLE
jgi:hypothetical protein